MGGARVWVPAGRARAEVFGPDADVRGDRDLPVLIVTGPDLAAAIAALASDLAGGTIEAELAPGGASPDPPLAGHCVALLNRGTPSSLVSADGTLHIGLMRASSAWPAGVWIDGERRTAPDGSSFAWQHWSHTFEYALVAGEGGWRDAGFTVAGQEYNHDLLACETGVHAGQLPAAASLCEVTGPSAMLSALKPHGNPLASGRPGPPRREDGVTVRLRDAGRGPGPGAAGTAARVRLFTAPGTARLTSLLEDADGPPLPLVDGAAEAVVPTAGTVTLALAGFGTGPEAGGPAGQRARTCPAGPAPRPNLPGRAAPRPNRPSRSSPGTGCTARAPPRPGTCRSRCTCPPAGSRSPRRRGRFPRTTPRGRSPRTAPRCGSPSPAAASRPAGW